MTSFAVETDSTDFYHRLRDTLSKHKNYYAGIIANLFKAYYC